MNTYLIKTIDLDQKYIEKQLESRGWKKQNQNNYVTFMFVDDKFVYDRSLYNIKSDIKNLVNSDKLEICDKNKLYNNFIKYNEQIALKYMMKQQYVDQHNYLNVEKFNSIHILKPIGSCLGVGIEIFKNYDEYIKYFEEFKNKKNDNRMLKDGFVLARYIENPFLYDNKKFHLRVYFLYDATNKKGYVYKKSKLTTAKQNYKKSDYKNNEIHDTHCLVANCGYVFPDDFDKKQSQIIFEQIKILFYHILKLINAGCFSESKKCFEIFGADIMINDNGHIKLLEINDKIGFHDYDKDSIIQLNRDIVDGMLLTIIDPNYKPNHEINDNIDNYLVDISNYSGDKYLDKYIKYKTKYLFKK